MEASPWPFRRDVLSRSLDAAQNQLARRAPLPGRRLVQTAM